MDKTDIIFAIGMVTLLIVFILTMVYRVEKPQCLENQTKLYEKVLVGKVMEYRFVGCEVTP